MKKDIDSIRDLCSRYITKPKLLLIPSMGMKTQVLKTLNDYGINPVNLDLKTIKELAYGIAEAKIIEEKLTILDRNSVTDVMSDLMNDLKNAGRLRFFNRLEITAGLCKAVASTVIEFNGSCADGSMDRLKVDNPDKGQDIALLLHTYEQFKKEHHYVDGPDLMKLALSLVAGKETRTLYQGIYVLESCRFEENEKALLKELKADLSEDKVPEEELTLTGAKNAEFVRAYGNYNEVKDVMRSILFGEIPFDHVVIVTVGTEPYVQLFYQMVQQIVYDNKELSKLKEFPITFGMGLPMLLSSPAKLLMAFLQWIGDGYKVHDFVNLFSSELFDFDTEEKFSRVTLTSCIKNADVKWQRSTYISAFEKYKASLEERVRWCEEHQSNAEQVQNRLLAVNWLLDFLDKEAFRCIPETDGEGRVDVSSLLAGLKTLVQKHHRVFSPVDVQGLNATLTELNTILQDRRIPLQEAADIIRGHMNEIRIMQESPSPGRIHMTTYHTADWNDREYVYLVGLDAAAYPGLAVEDPVLLDYERGETMRTSMDRIDWNIKRMNRFLAGITGNLIVSYCCFDTIENREGFPAILYHKLMEHFDTASIRDTGFIKQSEEEIFDEGDFWITKGMKYGAVAAGNPRYAGKNLSGQALSSAAGVIKTEKWNSEELLNLIDPRHNQMVLSASALRDYLTCRYRFFLKSILKVKEPGDEGLDTLGWLSHFEIGHLYHKIFEEFCRSAKADPGLLADEEKAVEFITALAEAEIKKYETELPVASEYYTDIQKRAVIEDCVRFAQDEVNAEEKVFPLLTEYEFGKDGSCSIDLGDGTAFKAYGMIDRVDRIDATGQSRITDYKSGSAYSYLNPKEKGEDLPNNVNIQPVLYYLALNELLKKGKETELAAAGPVKDAIYRFVTAKGDYESLKMEFDPASEAKYKSMMTHLFNQMAEGQFLPTGNGSEEENDKNAKAECRFCGYRNACQYSVSDDE